MPKRNLILFDDKAWAGLRPLTWLRPVSELRIGILTMAERWELLLTGQASCVTQDYLAEQYPLALARDNFFINASLLPTKDLVKQILQLSQGEALTQNDELLAARLDDKAILRISDPEGEGDDIPGYDYVGEAILLHRPYDLFMHNERMIAYDTELVCGTRHSQQLPETNTVIGDHPVFLEQGASIEACILNTTDGPIYLGKNSLVMEGSMLRGPIAVCESGVIKMGAKIYKGTTVGPHSKVGGEVSNVVFQGYCNKGHDGYLGNSVVGQWCNLGADTNASNLKNNYGNVRIWDYESESFTPSGTQFCGLIMGDHSKCGINTMFNTGTVIGVAANVFGSGFPRTFIPDFSWGSAAGMTTHKLPKVFETADLVKQRRKLSLSEHEKDVLEHVYALTKDLRRWE
ncbi:MAG: putative sugar nucleotidyl transferase [Saprospiraceae bacterium]